MSEELKAALARIACLEGEIAKRDEELAVCRVSVENCDVFRARIAELEARIVWLECEAQVNAAPVSEAKAQGVALDGSQLAGLLEQVRLDDDEAKPHGSGATYWNNAVIACQVAIRDALADHVQQVSVPDASTDFSQFLSAVMDAAGLVRHGRRSKELYEYLGSKCMEYRCFAAPAAPAADAWIPVSERLPESGQTVLAFYLNSHGKGRRIRAQYIKAWTVDVDDLADPDTECVEYSEQMDCYYLLEGWYECIDNWDEYYRVAVTEGPITHWMPLPAAPIKIEANRHDQ